MRYLVSIALFPLLSVMMACRAPHIMLAYKSPSTPAKPYSKIVVVGILKDQNDSLRYRVEKWMADDLQKKGYNAVTATSKFGPGNFAAESQAETYRRFCENGIDAVITIALVDHSREKNISPRKVYGYPNNYYFDRVWNYRNILGDINAPNLEDGGFFWECILFDLSTLEAQCTIQTRSFKWMDEKRTIRDFDNRIIGKMIKEKALPKPPVSNRKAF